MSKIIRHLDHIIDRTPGLDRYLSDLSAVNLDRLSDRDRLIVENHSLAMAVAMQYGYQASSIDDLFAAAMLGLCLAADRYNPSLGSFGTYAPQWIRKAVVEQLSLSSAPVHVPARMEQLRRRVVRQQERFFAANGYEPSPEQVAELLDLPLQQVQSVWYAPERSTSLSGPVGSDDDDTITLADTIADAHQPAEEDDKKQLVLGLLDGTIPCPFRGKDARGAGKGLYLSPRQREVLERYYLRGEDFRAIARAMHLTPARVRQIHRSACPF